MYTVSMYTAIMYTVRMHIVIRTVIILIMILFDHLVIIKSVTSLVKMVEPTIMIMIT